MIHSSMSDVAWKSVRQQRGSHSKGLFTKSQPRTGDGKVVIHSQMKSYSATSVYYVNVNKHANFSCNLP